MSLFLYFNTGKIHYVHRKNSHIIDYQWNMYVMCTSCFCRTYHSIIYICIRNKKQWHCFTSGNGFMLKQKNRITVNDMRN